MPTKNKRIVINNYKKWYDELKQIIELSNAENAAMSEEEQKLDKSRERAEVNELIKQINGCQQKDTDDSQIYSKATL